MDTIDTMKLGFQKIQNDIQDSERIGLEAKAQGRTPTLEEYQEMSRLTEIAKHHAGELESLVLATKQIDPANPYVAAIEKSLTTVQRILREQLTGYVGVMAALKVKAGTATPEEREIGEQFIIDQFIVSLTKRLESD